MKSLKLNSESTKILLATNMIEVHDENGPGHFYCPICNTKETMMWKNGRILNSGDDIVHDINCPFQNAIEWRFNKKRS